MRIQEIDTFLLVCKTGSFSKAAEQKFTTQPAISQQISSLEAEFGTQFFIRGKGKRGVVLTKEGQAFYQEAERWETLWTETKTAISNQGVTSYCFASMVSFSDFIFPRIHRAFTKFGNSCSLSLESEFSEIMIARIRSGDCDTCLSSSIENTGGLDIRPLANEDYVFVCRADADYAETISIRDLDIRNACQVSWLNADLEWYKRWFSNQGIPALKARGLDHFYQYFTDRNYWSIIPRSVLNSFPEGFRTCRLDVELPNRIFYLISKYPFFEPYYTEVKHAILEVLKEQEGMKLLEEQ